MEYTPVKIKYHTALKIISAWYRRKICIAKLQVAQKTTQYMYMYVRCFSWIPRYCLPRSSQVTNLMGRQEDNSLGTRHYVQEYSGRGAYYCSSISSKACVQYISQAQYRLVCAPKCSNFLQCYTFKVHGLK